MVLGAIVVAAVAGLVGPGPMSHTTAVADDGSLGVDYQRFARRGGSADITLTLSQDVVADGAAQILVSRDYLQQMTVESIVPQPSEEVLVGDAVRLTVPVSEPREAVVVQLTLTPDAMGAVAGSVAVPGHDEVAFSQFLYP